MTAIDENPNCARTFASFRLAGGELKPDEVSAALGLEPTNARERGQEIPVGGGGSTFRQPTGVWSLSSQNAVESTSLERHIVYLMDAIESAVVALDALPFRRHIKVDFFCYWHSAGGHGGPEISATTLARMAALDASLGIDFYDSDQSSVRQ